MTKTKEEVQTLAIQRATSAYGLAWPSGFSGSRLTRGMKLIINEAEKRGLKIEKETDLSIQVIRALQVIMLEIAQAHAQGVLELGAINQQVQGTPYEETIVSFNGVLSDQFRKQLIALYGGIAPVLYGQLGPIEIEEKPQTLIQRLLGWDGQ